MNTFGWFKGYRYFCSQMLRDGNASRLYLLLNLQSSDCIKMSVRTMSHELDMPVSTVMRALARLKNLGAISVSVKEKKTVIFLISHDNDKEKACGTKPVHKPVHQTVHKPVHQEHDDLFGNTNDYDIGGHDTGTQTGTPNGTQTGTGSGTKTDVLVRSKKENYKNIKTYCQKSQKAPKPPSKSGRVVSAYAEAYLVKYQVSPLVNAKTNSIACKIVDALGEEHAIEVVRHYLTVSSRFIDSNKHSIGVCLSRIDALSTEVKQKKLPMGGMTFGTFK